MKHIITALSALAMLGAASVASATPSIEAPAEMSLVKHNNVGR